MKIGLRTIKSCVAVFLSLAIFLGLHAVNYALGYDQSTFELSIDPQYWFLPTNFYTPFFASIAAVYALSRNVAESRKQAKLRTLGSVVGGYYGYVIIAITEWLFLDTLNLRSGTILYCSILYTIVALGIIGLIALTVKCKISYVTFISCLTYLSVTVSIRNGGMNAFLFATNRILSTVVGVLIALFINTFPQYFTKNRNILFVSSLDNLLLNEEHRFSPFMEYKLNALYGEKCNYTFMTTRAMTSLGGIFENTALRLPIVVMTGCATYDPIGKNYEGVVSLSPELRAPLEELFETEKVSVLSYLVNDNTLHAYYNDLHSEGAKLYYETRKKHASYSFVQASVPKQLPVAQYVIIDKDEIVEDIIEKVKKLPVAQEINVIHYPFTRLEGYSFLKINFKNAQKYTALERIKKDRYDYLVCFGSGRTDIEAMKKADFSVCMKHAPEYLREVADYVLPSDEPEDAVRLIAKIFHTKNYKKLVEELKKQKDASVIV